MKEALVSVIIPVYKVEDYIRQCIESIINQTYNNLEIILVDDGSPDNCPKICDEYALKDDRIIVIHKENGGLSSARNAGLDIFKGDYVSFVDSDDFVSLQFIEALMSMILNTDADLSECYFQRFKDNLNEVTLNISEINSVSCSGYDMELSLYDKNDGQSVIICNKLYKRQLFDNIRFPIGKIHEDEFTTYKIFNLCKIVSVTKEPLYYYRYNDNSITSELFNLKKLDLIDAFEERKDFYSVKNNANDILFNLATRSYQNTLRKLFFNSKKYCKEDKQISKAIINKMKNNFKDYFRAEKSFKRRFKYFCLTYFSSLYYFLTLIKDKIFVIERRNNE